MKYLYVPTETRKRCACLGWGGGAAGKESFPTKPLSPPQSLHTTKSFERDNAEVLLRYFYTSAISRRQAQNRGPEGNGESRSNTVKHNFPRTTNTASSFAAEVTNVRGRYSNHGIHKAGQCYVGLVPHRHRLAPRQQAVPVSAPQ